jgi:hypothetical protein
MKFHHILIHLTTDMQDTTRKIRFLYNQRQLSEPKHGLKYNVIAVRVILWRRGPILVQLYGGLLWKEWHGPDLSLSTSCFPCQCHSTSASYSYFPELNTSFCCAVSNSEWLDDNESERLWKKTVVLNSKYYPGTFMQHWGKPCKTSLSIVGALAKIRNGHLPIASLKP